MDRIIRNPITKGSTGISVCITACPQNKVENKRTVKPEYQLYHYICAELQIFYRWQRSDTRVSVPVAELFLQLLFVSFLKSLTCFLTVLQGLRRYLPISFTASKPSESIFTHNDSAPSTQGHQLMLLCLPRGNRSASLRKLIVFRLFSSSKIYQSSMTQSTLPLERWITGDMICLWLMIVPATSTSVFHGTTHQSQWSWSEQSCHVPLTGLCTVSQWLRGEKVHKIKSKLQTLDLCCSLSVL